MLQSYKNYLKEIWIQSQQDLSKPRIMIKKTHKNKSSMSSSIFFFFLNYYMINYLLNLLQKVMVQNISLLTIFHHYQSLSSLYFSLEYNSKKVSKGARGSHLNSSLSGVAISLMKLLKLFYFLFLINETTEVIKTRLHRNTGNFLQFLNQLLRIG